MMTVGRFWGLCMLMMLRERMKGVVAGVMVTLMAVIFALFGLQYYLTNTHAEPYVAKVNGESISLQTFNRLLKMQKSVLQGVNGQQLASQPAFLNMLKKQVLDHLLGQTLYQQAIAALPLAVTDEMVQQHLMTDPMFLQNDQFSKELYEQYLAQSFLTSEQFLSLSEWQLKEQQVNAGVKQSALVMPDELSHAVSLYYQQRDIGYFLIDPEHFVAQEHVGTQVVKKYFNDHASQFATPERIKLAYVLLDANVLKKNIHVGDAELKRIYTSEAGHFISPAQLTYSMIAWPLPADASKDDWRKAEQAMQHISQDWKQHRSSAWLEALQQKDKHLGVTKEKTVLTDQLPGYAQHLSLAKAGQVTPPVRIDAGVVVLRVDAKRAATQQSFAQVAPRLKARLVNQRVTELFSESAEQLADLAYTHPSSLAMVNQTLKLPVRETGWMTNDDALAKLHSLAPHHASLVKEAAFSDDVLKAGNNSRVLSLKDGLAMVVRVSQHEASRPQAYSPEVADKIAMQLRADKAKVEARAMAHTLVAALKAGQSPVQLAKKYQLLWHQQAHVSMLSPPKSLNKNLVDAAFKVHGDPKQSAMVTSMPLADGKHAVLQVLAFHQPKVGAKQRTAMEARLRQLHADLSMAMYLQPVMAKAKITVNKDQALR